MSKDSTIKNMKVSVVVPVYNEEAYITDCLKSLVEQSESPDEIIIVDNNSTDKTIDIVKTFPGITIVKETTQGMIHARNKGFNSAQYEIIARTDADARVPKNWIKKIKQNFQKDKKLIALSGPMHFYSRAVIEKVSKWPTAIYLKAVKQSIGHDMLIGPNMAIRTSSWYLVKNDVCLNDKDVHEDIDLSMHLSPFGKIKFDKKLIVSASFRRYKKLAPYFEYPYRTIKTIRRHKETLLERHSKKIVKKVFSKSKTLMKHLQKFPDQI